MSDALLTMTWKYSTSIFKFPSSIVPEVCLLKGVENRSLSAVDAALTIDCIPHACIQASTYSNIPANSPRGHVQVMLICYRWCMTGFFSCGY